MDEGNTDTPMGFDGRWRQSDAGRSHTPTARFNTPSSYDSMREPVATTGTGSMISSGHHDSSRGYSSSVRGAGSSSAGSVRGTGRANHASNSSSTTLPGSSTSNATLPGSSSSNFTGPRSSLSNCDMAVSDVGQARGDGISDSDQAEDEICLSVVWTAGSIGIAYYNVSTTEVYLMPDTADMDNFPVLSRVLLQTKPNYVVTSAKEDDGVLQAISSTLNVEKQMDAQFMQILPSVDFSLGISKQRILNLNLPGVPSDLSDTERNLHFQSLIPFSNVCMLRALGGLIKFIEKNRLGMQLDDMTVKIPVLAIKIFSLEDLMLIDEQTYNALQIFQKANHPSVNKASYKEDISLFRMLDRCSSKSGSRLLRLWFLHPLKDIQKLKERHECVEYFSDSRNMEMTMSLQKYIHQMRDTEKILARMARAHATVNDWQTLYKTVYCAMYIADICKEQRLKLPIMDKIKEHFTDDLYKIANLICKIVDFDESLAQARFVVKTNIDADLDEKKRTFRGLPDIMTTVARDEIASLGDDITHCNVFYLPHLGYLLSIPLTHTMKETQDYELPGMEFVFVSNNVAHYKSVRMKELDRMLGDTQCDITDYETGVMHKLQNILLEHRGLIVDVVQCAAELDCLLSFATCAREYNYVKPTLTMDNVLQIKRGRHAILDGCCDNLVVPNDMYSGGEYSRMKVLTGPNASGKSIYIKQVALIVYMAQIGSFVPAEQAVIGIMDGIYTRIKTTESISVALSSFMIDLNQISTAIHSANARSLVLLDEFGTGTDATDGLALLASCLQHWLDRGHLCPHTLVSTHFYKIVNKLQPSQNLAFQTMEVLQDEDELVFLYQLKDGHTDASFTQMVAKQFGLCGDIVKRGIEVSQRMQVNLPIGSRKDIGSTSTQYEHCLTINERFLALDLEKDDVVAFLKDVVIPLYEGTNLS